MLVDAHGRLDTEQDLVDVDPVVGSRRPRRNRRDGRRPVGAADIAVTDNAAQLHVVHLFFKRGDADAETPQLVGELGGQLVHKGLVISGRIFCHGPGDHLRHFITRDFLIAAIRAVAVALDHAVGGELRYGVVSPMVGGDVLERICGGKGRGRRTGDQGCGRDGYEKFFHQKVSLKNRMYEYCFKCIRFFFSAQ